MTTGRTLAALSPVSLDAVPTALRGGVVAIGNFDGVHRGHVALLSATKAEAARLSAPAVVLTFEPHPRTVFRPESPVFRLTPPAAKGRILKALGFDGMAVAPFSVEFSAKPAEAFIADVLVGQLGVRGVVVGYDFQFGKGRAGTPAMLVEAGAAGGFDVTTITEICDGEGRAFSSSAIRENLAEGDIASANAALGYRWFVTGTIVKGDQRGRELGYPTANMRLGDDCRLRHGVYAVRVHRPGGLILDGVASFGRRPTFDNGAPLLETFVFDFSGSLYGEELAIEFVGWIRPELKFDGIEPLIEAMDRDSLQARDMLAAAGPGTALDQALAALG